MNKRNRDKYEAEQIQARIYGVLNELQNALEQVRKKVIELHTEKDALETVRIHDAMDREQRKKEHNIYGQLFVKMLDGKTITLDEIADTNTVEVVKFFIWEKTSIPIEKQRLIFAGKQLENGRTLREYGVISESTFHMVLRITGCWIKTRSALL